MSIADRPYFRRALETKSLAVSDLLAGQLSGRKLLALAQPTLDDRGAVETVLILTLDPKIISDLLARVPLPQDATIGVLDRQGQRVARVPYDPALIGDCRPWQTSWGACRARATATSSGGTRTASYASTASRIRPMSPIWSPTSGWRATPCSMPKTSC